MRFLFGTGERPGAAVRKIRGEPLSSRRRRTLLLVAQRATTSTWRCVPAQQLPGAHGSRLHGGHQASMSLSTTDPRTSCGAEHLLQTDGFVPASLFHRLGIPPERV